MAAAGVSVDLNLTDHAVIGILEVLPKLKQFFGFVDQAEAIFAAGKVDAVLLVDFPGFNWHIAKRAKKYGLPVYYYCPPQLWAWGGWRIRKLKRTVDHVLSALPIECEYYDRHGVPNTLVGHPFFDDVAEHVLDGRVMRSLGSNQDRQPVVAVLPGSRSAEVSRNWPVMLAAIRRLAVQHPATRFAVATHRDDLALRCRQSLGPEDQNLNLEFFVGRTAEVIESARCSMMVSGSVSLEMLARRTPASVIYRISRSLNFIARRLVHLDSITLPNLLAGRRLFPEMVSCGDPQPAVDFLVSSTHAFLRDDYYHRRTLAAMDRLRTQHARAGASKIAAKWLADQMRRPTVDIGESTVDADRIAGEQTETSRAA